MDARRTFTTSETHGVLQQFHASIGASSDGLGWSSAYASMQRERPFEGRFHAISDCLMVMHRGGPVDVTFRTNDRSVTRNVPRGGFFFLPAGRECDVSLHADLDTIHIYLRAELFAERHHGKDVISDLTPLLGESDPVLEHLAGAIGEAVADSSPQSSLFVDPIAQAMASRFMAIGPNRGAVREPPRPTQLSSRQLQRVRDFVEAQLETDIRLNAMAQVCGLSTEYFMRQFKATVGVSPYQYVLNLRVERVKQLLEQGDQSLSEIALQCGFSHQEHMTRMFRRFTGVTPGRYRRASR
ncbi:MAG TPA: AraC family transcriptional regulator [Xanthobacteraceae bacterium]|nr:AraC family transcriptional regulator [Xanthobacteraceae bacterium]